MYGKGVLDDRNMREFSSHSLHLLNEVWSRSSVDSKGKPGFYKLRRKGMWKSNMDSGETNSPELPSSSLLRIASLKIDFLQYGLNHNTALPQPWLCPWGLKWGLPWRLHGGRVQPWSWGTTAGPCGQWSWSQGSWSFWEAPDDPVSEDPFI